MEVFHAMGIIKEQGSAGTTTPAAKPEKEADSAPEKSAEKACQPGVMNGERRWYTPVVRAIARQNKLSEADLAAKGGL